VTAIRVPIHEQRDASYDVIVGRGVLERLPELLSERCAAHSYAVIADHKVAELFGATLMRRLAEAGLNARLFSFPAGEWNKTREQWAELTDALLKARVGRDGAVVAFGGGVAGDLAGFVAATYLRGVPYVQVPTTLLAMIDSSIGGKTGVDVPAGKNLVGTFHQPRLVLADVDLLATLPRPQLAAGMAEALKHGVIADAGYFASLQDADGLLARNPERLLSVVRRSVEIKAAVVSADEREAGRRQILNFGHTVGHAVEARSGFELLHGEAVAVGMTVEARLAESLGLAAPGTLETIKDALQRFGLPTGIGERLSADELIEVMKSDKKSREGALFFALPKRIGEVAQSADGGWTVQVAEPAVIQALTESR
jgi:3-dehydroquinate synthase